MKALIFASVLAAASPDAAPTPEPSAAPDTRVTTTESRCKNIGRGLASGVQIARSKNIGFDDYLALAGLHWPATLKEPRELDPIERMTANVIFVLYEWPFELDPHRVVATQLATNMCLKLFQRAR